MSTSAYDSFRPPEPARRRKGGKRRRRRGGGRPGDGSREMAMVPDVEFTSYYGRPIVKAPPWGNQIPAYLFLGGLAGAGGLLAAVGQVTGRPALQRNMRLTAVAATALSGATLVDDLGRPERFLNMMRTVKLTSPMSVGTWILTGYGATTGIASVAEADRLLRGRLPLGPARAVLTAADRPVGLAIAALGAPLAAYTAVLIADTATPTWNAVHGQLPFVFGASASCAAAGLAMVTTPAGQAEPARRLGALGAAADLAATTWMERAIDPVVAEPLHTGKAGWMLRASKALTVAGGVGSLLAGRHRAIAAASGIALLGASALTRFGIFEAGMASAKDPRYTVEPQKRRLEERRAAGVTHDSITTP